MSQELTKNHMNHYDLIVIGAGPAGLYFTINAITSYKKILIIEKNNSVIRKSCGEYICPQGVSILKERGHENLLGGFRPLYGMKIYNYNGHLIDTTFPNDSSQTNYGVSINRLIFENRLCDLAKAKGAIIHFDEEVQSLTFDEKWLIKTNKKFYTSDLLIGSDGRRSITSKYLKLNKTHKHQRIALHTLVKHELLERKGEMHLFSDGSYIGLNPINENELNITLVTDIHTIQNEKYHDTFLINYLNQSTHLKTLVPLIKREEVKTVYPIFHKNRSIIFNQGALIGDAASFLDPLTGEGLFNALQTAVMLADELQNKSLTYKKQFLNYQQKNQKKFKEKYILNNIFQWLIKAPRLLNFIEHFLLKRADRPDIFIGIIGNIYTPLEGLKKMLT